MKNLAFKIISGFFIIAHFNVFGQVPNMDLSNFNEQQRYFSEKIYIHTDKPIYFANDILWFKAYNLSNLKNGLSTISKVIYIELLDEKNNPKVQAMVAAKDGTANGSLQLSKLIETGTYRLRAYTNLMKNTGPESFFEKGYLYHQPVEFYQLGRYKKANI